MTQLKKTLRQQALANRQKMDMETLSKRLCVFLEQLPVFQHAESIGLFWPFAHEVNLTPLIHFQNTKASFNKKQWLFPRMAEKTLTFHAIEAKSDLSAQFVYHPWGVWEPTSSLPAWDFEKKKLDILIVPALLVDERGFRLGYGKGFYDRFMAALLAVQPQCFALSVIPHACLVKTLPQDEWDVPVRAVLTESAFKEFPF